MPTLPAIIEIPATIQIGNSNAPAAAEGIAAYAKRANTANTAAFVATLMNAVTGKGAPSYTSGAHVWNGTKLILNAKPTKNRPAPSQKIGLDTSAGFTKSANCTLPVAPKSRPIP